MEKRKRRRWPGRLIEAVNVNMQGPCLANIDIRTRPAERAQGWLSAGPWQIKVALGRSGIRANKREGDGATPAGRYRPERLWGRRDRMPRPAALLPARGIGPAAG